MELGVEGTMAHHIEMQQTEEKNPPVYNFYAQEANIAGQSPYANVSNEISPEYNPNVPKCMCGLQMTDYPVAENFEKQRWCDICGFNIHEIEDQSTIVYTCPRGGEPPHSGNSKLILLSPYNKTEICNVSIFPQQGGYDMCHKCGEKIKELQDKAQPVPQKYTLNTLFYIYNDNKISGPFTTDEIILLYVKRKIKDNTLYIKSAASEDNIWHKLIFPRKFYSKLKDKDTKRFETIPESLTVNAEIKHSFPELYTQLIENTIIGTLRQVDPPSDVPADYKRAASIYYTLITILGRFLAISMGIFMIIHNLASILIACCWCCCGLICVGCCGSYEGNVIISTILITYSGMLYVPGVVVYVVLSESTLWSEIQSWMISYIVWALVSYIFSSGYWGSTFTNSKSKLNLMDSTVKAIIGVDLGDISLVQVLSQGGVDLSAMSLMGLTFILPAFAALLPAAIIGFIANFILEEKFELQCGDNIESSYLCFEAQYGCCEVISSHDYRNTYQFLGGLASNCIAVWAIIRIVGYLVVNAFPAFSAYATRRK